MVRPRYVCEDCKNRKDLLANSHIKRYRCITCAALIDQARRTSNLRITVPPAPDKPVEEASPSMRLGLPPAITHLKQRVLLIAETSIQQCMKYRVLQKQEMIQALGIDCTVVPWCQVDDVKELLHTHTVAIFYRVPALPKPLELIHLAKELGVMTFWEVDDLIFDYDLYRTNRNLNDLRRDVRDEVLRGVPLFRKAMLTCDACIASTEAMAQAMRSAGVKTVHVIENGLDSDTLSRVNEVLRQPKKDDGIIRIVYGSGSASHDSDFRIASKAIFNVLRNRKNVRLTLIGPMNLPPEFKMVPLQVERHAFSDYATYIARLGECDINIAPLEVGFFNEAKSTIKFLEAAALMIPTICSPTKEYERIIDCGKTGFVASTAEEWETSLLTLIDNPSLRKSVGEQARAYAIENYDCRVTGQEKVLPILKDLQRFKKDRLRVLGVNIFFEPRSFGGATIVAEEVARTLNSDTAVEYAVLTTSPIKEARAYKVTRYQSSAAEVFALGLPSETRPMADFDNPNIVAAFREVIRSWEPDVVHLHSIQRMGVQLAEVCSSEGIPYVVTAHDAWWICGRQFMVTKKGEYCLQETVDTRVCAQCVVHPEHNTYRQHRLHQALSHAERILVPSQFFKKLYGANGFTEEKIVVNKNGVVAPARKMTRTKPSTRPLRLGYVGGEGPRKGSDRIKHALQSMPEITNYELKVVDPELNLGSQTIFEKSWKIPGKLTIVPAYTQRTIDDFFEGIDILLFPTRCKESFGLAIREALIRDVWVITTDGGGVVEDIVPDSNGNVIPMETADEEFKIALRYFLLNPSALDDYSNRYTDTIHVFKDQSDELTQIFHEIRRQ